MPAVPVVGDQSLTRRRSAASGRWMRVQLVAVDLDQPRGVGTALICVEYQSDRLPGSDALGGVVGPADILSSLREDSDRDVEIFWAAVLGDDIQREAGHARASAFGIRGGRPFDPELLSSIRRLPEVPLWRRPRVCGGIGVCG